MHCLLTQPESLLLAAWNPIALLDSVWPYLLIFLGFSVIVFVHELGHFAVAKWAGVRVEKFAVGFGREIFGITRGETRYSFNILPLGGYVKMLGQEDFDDKAKELQFKNDPRSFINKPVGHRMAIVSAGVVMNVLLACLLFMVVFMIGKESIGTRIAYVEPDSPADRAGLLPGDVIAELNGHRVLEWGEVQTEVLLAPPHQEIEFVVRRDGELRHVAVEPEYLIPENSRDARRQVVGIAPGVTREIFVTGPDMDPNDPKDPHVGDMLVAVGGVEITDENASEAVHMLAYETGDVIVERRDPSHPGEKPKRVRVQIPPILTLYPSDDEQGDTASVLGLVPLVRFNAVYEGGRADLAGIDIGDTVLAWDDIQYPSRGKIARAIQDSAERDIYFIVRKRDKRVFRGFVRPERISRGPATIQALTEPIDRDSETGGAPRALFVDVRPRGIAHDAGIESDDVILSCADVRNPAAADVNYAIRTNAGGTIPITVRRQDGETLHTQVVPAPPGTIDAKYNLVAEDVLRVGGVVETLNGKPSPAAEAGIPAGVLITEVNGQPISRWRDLIDAFRASAGSTVQLAYIDQEEHPHTVPFAVPRSLRTVLGVGPEARIISIDGRRTVDIKTAGGREQVAVGYRKGTKAELEELVGRTDVPVEYRATPLSEIETARIDVAPDMVDPWLSRIAFQANIDVMPETTLLKGENALDAVWIGMHKTYYFILQVYKTMERMIFTRSVGVESISGPLGIIDIGGRIARTGFVELLFFMAIISANLAVINFLPLPIVDGGLMVFLIIEKIKGSPVSLRVQIATQMLGLFLIIGVFLFVTFNDAMRMWG